MSKATLRKVDELIELIDAPCDCEDGSCRLCRIMGLLWSVRDDLAPGMMSTYDSPGDRGLH